MDVAACRSQGQIGETIRQTQHGREEICVLLSVAIARPLGHAQRIGFGRLLKHRARTSGGDGMLRERIVKFWPPIQASAQASVSASGGESHLQWHGRGCHIRLGRVSFSSEARVQVLLRVWTDGIAMIGVCGHQGLAKLLRMDAQRIWIQHRVTDGTFDI